MTAARVLPIHIVEKPWGRERLPRPFDGSAGKRIGEVWLEPPPELEALLVKYLFTSEKLSVQVHPGDDQAPSGARGQDEGWMIVDAEPGAQLAIGFVKETGLRKCAAPRSMVQLSNC